MTDNQDQQPEIQQPADVIPPEQGERQPQTPAVADEVLPSTLHLLPVPHRPFFPGQVQPVVINPEQWQSTLEAVAQSGTGLLGLSYVDTEHPEQAGTGQFPAIGCVVRLHRPPIAGDNMGQFLVQGIRRFRMCVGSVTNRRSWRRWNTRAVRAIATAMRSRPMPWP